MHHNNYIISLSEFRPATQPQLSKYIFGHKRLNVHIYQKLQLYPLQPAHVVKKTKPLSMCLKGVLFTRQHARRDVWLTDTSLTTKLNSPQSGLLSEALLYCIIVPAICSRRDRIILTRLINSTSLDPRSLSMASFTVRDTPRGPGVNSFLSETNQK